MPPPDEPTDAVAAALADAPLIPMPADVARRLQAAISGKRCVEPTWGRKESRASVRGWQPTAAPRSDETWCVVGGRAA